MIKLRRLAVIVGVSLGMIGSAAEDASAEPPRALAYHYVSLTAALPAPYLIADPVRITDDRRIYMTAWQCPLSCLPSVAVYRNGTTTILNAGMAYDANDAGVVGGSLLVDPDNFVEQAAVFFAGHTFVIPRLAGERSSHVRKVTNTGIALVESQDANYVSKFYLYDKERHVRPLEFGPDQVDSIQLNDDGVLAGTIYPLGPNNDRAFRMVGNTKTLLAPLPTEPESWGQGLNQNGDVLGYSFIAGAIERIGYWHKNKFETMFVEGTPAVPTISNRLLWNEKKFIVITNTSRSDMNSYVVPRANVRFKLADVTDTLPIWTSMYDVNGRGDIIGVGGSAYYNAEDTFVLERTNRDL